VCVYLLASCCIGQLGIGNTVTVGDNETPGQSTTVDFGAGAIVTAVSIGGFMVCAVVDGTVKCWGDGYYGIGQGNTNDLGGTAYTTPAYINPIK
jgi:alpha-tubulin suppressor-like RCC1 family protein